ncbi:hypothetical protein L6R53_17415 [Myxococcota bacterium]|nr:hypothetical protein [Myxococcota bacterium]
MTTHRIALVALVGLLAAGCKNDSTLAVVVDHGTGDVALVEGRVCDPDRGTWLEGADVYMHLFDANGSHYNTLWDETDADGRFQLVDVPVDGLQPVYVQYGAQVIDQFEITIPVGQTYVVLPDPVCGGGSASMAVVTGDYDDFEVTLEALGFGDFDLVNGQTGDELVQFLSSEAALAAYDVIFFGGGHLEEDVFYDTDGSDVDRNVDKVKGALLAYVQAGGKVVATDWSYDVVEAVWPDQITFLGQDNVPDDAQRGETGTVSARVMDESMATAVGVDRLDLTYDLIEYPVVASVDASTTTWLQGDVVWREGESTSTQAGSPLLVSFSSGAGSVWFSTFRFGANTEGDAKAAVTWLLNHL